MCQATFSFLVLKLCKRQGTIFHLRRTPATYTAAIVAFSTYGRWREVQFLDGSWVTHWSWFAQYKSLRRTKHRKDAEALEAKNKNVVECMSHRFSPTTWSILFSFIFRTLLICHMLLLPVAHLFAGSWNLGWDDVDWHGGALWWTFDFTSF